MEGAVFVSVADRDKSEVVSIGKQLVELGYVLLSTRGTGDVLAKAGVPVEIVPKLQEGRPNLIDHMKNGRVAMVINTPSGRGSRTDEAKIRAAAVASRVTCITTISAALAAVEGCKARKANPNWTVTALQDRYKV
jgi:carbamoyl-phosphate synthase large subunit